MDAGSSTELDARSIVTTRVIDAPRELVFESWTSPEHLARWWGPNGFTTTTHAFDFRAGGEWRLTMHGPDGRDYENHVRYREIVRPECIAYDHGGDGGKVMFRSTITFEDLGGRTRLTMRGVFDTKAQRDLVAETYGAVEGAKQTLDRLADYVDEGAVKFTRAVSKPRELTLKRIIRAPRALVFRAWTDPAMLAAWWGPKGFTNPRCEADARPGGGIRIDMRGPDGTVYPMDGRFEDVVPPERLSFTSSALGPDGKPLFTVRNTVIFTEAGGLTTLTLHAQVVEVFAAVAERHLGGMNEGWNQSLDRLAAFVSSSQGL